MANFLKNRLDLSFIIVVFIISAFCVCFCIHRFERKESYLDNLVKKIEVEVNDINDL